MLLTAISVAIAVFIALLLIFFIVSRRVAAEKAALIRVLLSYTQPQGEKHDQPSEFDKVLDTTAQYIGHHTAQSLKGIYNSSLSAETKATKRIEGALEIDMLSAQGGLAGALGKLPTVQDLVKKNPGWGPLVLQLLSRGGGMPAETNAPSQDNGDDFARQIDSY